MEKYEVTFDTGRQIVEAAYYTFDGSWVIFKDADGSFIFTVAAIQVFSIARTK